MSRMHAFKFHFEFGKMWMAYVEYKKPHNLSSSVEVLAKHFTNLEFDAEHEAYYGMDRFYTFEECMKLAKKYEDGKEACNLFLDTSDLRSFLHRIKDLNLQQFLDDVQKFTPNELFDEIFA